MSEERPAEITVEFDLAPEEWVDVAVEHNRSSARYRSGVRRTQGVFGLLVVVLALLAVLGGQSLFAWVWLFAGATTTAFVPSILERSLRKQYRSFAEEGIAHGMFATHRVRLTDEGMLDETAAYVRLTRWHAIDQVVDGPGAFLVYMGRNAFMPIPHSAFRDSATLRAFADRFFEGLATATPGRIEDGGTHDARPDAG